MRILEECNREIGIRGTCRGAHVIVARGQADCSIIPACGKADPLGYRLGSVAINANEKKARSLSTRISMCSWVRVNMASVVNGAKRICWRQKSLMKFSVTGYSRNCIHTGLQEQSLWPER